MKNTKNLFAEELRIAETVEKAWNNGDLLFDLAYNCMYRQVSKEQLFAFLKSSYSIMDNNNLIALFTEEKDTNMPSDAKIGIIYEPSYAVSAATIYAFNNWPEKFSEKMKQDAITLIESTFEKGIFGHGSEGAKMIRKTVKMLCCAGAKKFVKNNRDLVPNFSKIILRYISDYKMLLLNAEKDKKTLYEYAFVPIATNAILKDIIASWEGKQRHIFVYGTLMRGERANYLLETSTYLGKYCLKGYTIYNLGTYPGIKKCDNKVVFGELYCIDEKTALKIDIYEGSGLLYTKESVKVNAGSYQFDADVYVYNGNVNNKEHIGESWRVSDNDKVVYAAYGSNLSSERFSCYVKGGVCKENGRMYYGCQNKADYIDLGYEYYIGNIYFAKYSTSWNNKGVAFYDNNGNNRVIMRLYEITRGQLRDIMYQEGQSWYGNQLLIGTTLDGKPIYTLTSFEKFDDVVPDIAYIDLIKNALVNECNYSDKVANSYIENFIKHK